MYSEKVSNLRLESLQPSLPFQLERHDVEECRQFVDWIDNLINKDAYLTAAKRGVLSVKKLYDEGGLFKSDAARNAYLAPQVQNRIQNERLISQNDANYWMERYYLIKDITGVFKPYSPLASQRIWKRIMADLNEKGLPIKLLDLKGRQQGDTTQKQGYVQHRLSFWPDTDSLIASKQDKDTDIMSRKILSSLERQPFWLKPELISFTTGEGYRFDNGSFIDLGAGTQEYLGKGQTPTVCHISEIASFKYPKSALENALFRAMHETEWLLQFLEGTAEARDDWFHKKVLEVISGMERGTTSWYFNFIAWFFRRDLYPTPTYIKARSEAFAKFIPKPETLAMAKMAENSVKSWKYSREELGSNWKMDKEQLFYYEVEREQAEKEERLAEFLSQMPTTMDEAFQHAGKTLYPVQLIEDYSRRAQSIIPEVYKLKGDPSEVSPNYWPQPDEILDNGKTITITCAWNHAIPPSTFELIQIKFDGWNNFDPVGKFLIWFHPKPGEIYAQAVDTSDGLGRDISDDAVININRVGTADLRDRQVLEFASPEIPLGSMWPFVLVSATYYSYAMGQQLLSTIECNKGYELQNAMIYRGWWNLFKRVNEDSPYQDESKIQKYGWWTDRGNRPGLIGHFHQMILGRHYEIYSPMLIAQIRDLQKVRKPNAELGFANEKIMGKKDDRVLAGAINLTASHRGEIIGHEKKTWEARNSLESNAVDIKTFKGFEFEREDIEEDLVREMNQVEEFGNFFGEGEEDFAFGELR